MVEDTALLLRRLERERAARKAAEQLLEQKSSELYERGQQLEREVADRVRAEEAMRNAQQKAQLESSLRASEARFRKVVEASPSGTLMVNTKGEIVLANMRAEQLFGYPRGGMLGQRIEALLPTLLRTHYPGLRDGAMHPPHEQGTSGQRTLYACRRDGDQVPVEIDLNPVAMEEGECVLATVLDISERRRNEQALLAANGSLIAQVQETAQAMQLLRNAQDQLVQSEKLASLGALVAGVAHEINTPVGVAITASSMLHAESRRLMEAVAGNALTRSDFSSFLENLSQSSQILLSNLTRAADLIQSFKRVAADQSSEEYRSFALGSYLKEVLLSLRPTLRQGGHSVTLACPEDLEIFASPGALSQIISNFVVNAITHAYREGQAGNMHIAVSTVNNTVQMVFSDDGNGISDALLPRIFDPFFTTRRGQGGTGLGLNIVFNLVKKTLGGEIRVESIVGQGTRFYIGFPLHKDPPVA